MSNIIIEPPRPHIQGVKPQVASKIQEMLENGTRYFGSSGASLTHQAFNPEMADKGIDPTMAKIGLEGERDTTTILKKWMEDKPNVVLCDSVHIRGWGKEEVDPETGFIDGGDTDHVVLIGNEVVLIDTKRWKSKRGYEVSPEGEILRSKKPFPGGKIHMMRAVNMWVKYLAEGAVITGFVHINTEEISVFRNRNWYKFNFRVVELDRFVELMDQKYNEYTSEDNKSMISSTLVSQVALNTVKPYDARTRVMNMEGLAAFK